MEHLKLVKSTCIIELLRSVIVVGANADDELLQQLLLRQALPKGTCHAKIQMSA
jgi:hypothetical protein